MPDIKIMLSMGKVFFTNFLIFTWQADTKVFITKA